MLPFIYDTHTVCYSKDPGCCKYLEQHIKSLKSFPYFVIKPLDSFLFFLFLVGFFCQKALSWKAGVEVLVYETLTPSTVG